MKRATRLALFCSSLFVAGVAGGDSGQPAVDNADEAAVGMQTGEEIAGTVSGAATGKEDTAVTIDEKESTEAKVDRGGSTGAAPGKKSTGTATAAGYLYNQVKQGNIKIQGATDTD